MAELCDVARLNNRRWNAGCGLSYLVNLLHVVFIRPFLFTGPRTGSGPVWFLAEGLSKPSFSFLWSS